MNLFVYILFFSLLGSVVALTGASVILLFSKMRERLRIVLLSYSIGTLLGAVFIGLLPTAIEHASADATLKITLTGFVCFFILEKVIRIPHKHAYINEVSPSERKIKNIHPAAPLILLGDFFHNFTDGVLITTSFFVSIHLGIVSSFAVLAHEVPQELGDFVILLESGLDKNTAYLLNLLSSLGTLVGALLTYWIKEEITAYLPHILALSASSFLYIAAVDLAPILHQYSGIRAGLKQTFGLLLGVGTILLLHVSIGH